MITSLAQGGHQVSLNSLARVTVGVRISLDFFLVGQGRDCGITITYAALRGNALHHVERSIQTLNAMMACEICSAGWIQEPEGTCLRSALWVGLILLLGSC